MSDVSQGPGWWLASDGKWYPPHTAPGAAPTSDVGFDSEPDEYPYRTDVDDPSAYLSTSEGAGARAPSETFPGAGQQTSTASGYPQGEPQYSQAQYPQSEPRYPQAQYPQSEPQYPQSEPQYPQAQYPQTPYPQVDPRYPGYADPHYPQPYSQADPRYAAGMPPAQAADSPTATPLEQHVPLPGGQQPSFTGLLSDQTLDPGVSPSPQLPDTMGYRAAPMSWPGSVAGTPPAGGHGADLALGGASQTSARGAATPGDPSSAAGALTVSPAPHSSDRPATGGRTRAHWQPWLALVGVALVLWGAGQGLLTWSEWHLVAAQFSPYGTVLQGHIGMALTAAGEIIAGLATLTAAMVLDRR